MRIPHLGTTYLSTLLQVQVRCCNATAAAGVPVVDQDLSALRVVDHVVVSRDLDLVCLLGRTSLDYPVVLLKSEHESCGPLRETGSLLFSARVCGTGER